MTSKAPSFVKLAGSATFDLRAYCPYWPSPLIHTVAPSVPPLESGWGAFAERRRTMRAHRRHAPAQTPSGASSDPSSSGNPACDLITPEIAAKVDPSFPRVGQAIGQTAREPRLPVRPHEQVGQGAQLNVSVSSSMPV
jgi:hypothetical protein